MKLGGLLRRFTAAAWARWIRAQYRAADWITRRRLPIGIGVGILLFGCTVVASSHVQRAVEPYLVTGNRLGAFQEALVALGGALLGATVITFSFVMFALQVNVERMPHGLFQRLSSDRKLLGAFFTAFLLAAAVLVSSLAVDTRWVGALSLGTVWATLLILVLFTYSYRRALALINPSRQLSIVVDIARRDLRRWSRLARRVAPLLERADDVERTAVDRPTHDLPRLRFFEANRHWTNRAQQAVTHAMTLAHHYTERGDHEVAEAALTAVIAINAGYVEAKGKTFFASLPPLENPYVTDGFINETLEQLRQSVRIAVRRGDERQIEQTFRAMAALATVYLKIDYTNEHASMTHAHLAAGYLKEAVKAVIPHDMPDVLMEGARILGDVARRVLARDEPTAVVDTVEVLGELGAVGVLKQDHRPVTTTAAEQLSELTWTLLLGRRHDAVFVGKKIRETMTALAKVFMQLPDTPLQNVVSQSLAPYYSTASDSSLPAKVVQLANALIKAKEDDADAKHLIRNVEQWFDHLHVTYRDLLRTAIEKKSHFMFDVVHGVEHFAGIMLALSNAPACGDRTGEELRRHAVSLVSVLSWIPDERDAVQFAETYQVTETLFSVTVEAANRDCRKEAQRIRELLVSWAMKAARHDAGWAIPERALSALSALAVRGEGEDEARLLLSHVTESLSKPNAPSPEQRARTAGALREIGRDYRDPNYTTSMIDHAVAAADPGRLQELLEKVAASLEL